MLAILSTHPVQYQAPLWQALAKDGSVPFEVWYLTDHGTQPSYDRQFGKTFAWDLDVLSGYSYRFLKVNKGADISRVDKVRIKERLPRLFEKKSVCALWVLGWEALAYWQAVWQAHAAGVPVWLRGESNDFAITPFWKKPVKQLALGLLFNRVQRFLYIGQANRRFYEGFGVRQEQLHPAPYCVDNERFTRQSEQILPRRDEIRRFWNIPENAFCVMFAAKFIDKKRPFDLIKALDDSRLRNLDRPLHLLFAGSGDLGSALRGACHVVFDAESIAHFRRHDEQNDRGLPRASFVGFLNQTEISKAYAAADCLVLPSDQRETWGLVVNEALASGLPCLVSDACGCCEDLIAPINSRFRFPMGDTVAIADALLYLIKHPCPSAALREQVAKFSVSTSVRTVCQLYHASAL